MMILSMVLPNFESSLMVDLLVILDINHLVYVLMLVIYHHDLLREYKSVRFYEFILIIKRRKIEYIPQVQMSRKEKKYRERSELRYTFGGR